MRKIAIKLDRVTPFDAGKKERGTFSGYVTKNIPGKGPADIEEVKKFLAIMEAGAPKGTLDDTVYSPGIPRASDEFGRAWDNPRLGLLSRPLGLWSTFGGKVEGDQIIPDPHYNWVTNRVVSPWNNLSVGMHELGHAIDFNDYALPENAALRLGRNTIADVYRFAPLTTLWKEHAAWRRGQNALVNGAVKLQADPEFLYKILRQRDLSKPTALGTYWGGGIGGTVGLLGSLAALYAYIKAGNEPPPGRVAGGLAGLATMATSTAGVVAGSRIGKWLFERSESRKTDAIMERYLGTRRWKELKEKIHKQEAAETGKKKSTERDKKKPAATPELKVAAFRLLQNASWVFS